MTRWQIGVLWSAPPATAIALGSFYGAVGGAAGSGWIGIVMFSALVAAIATVFVLTIARHLPGVEWFYGYWVGMTWWLSGIGVQANIHMHSPDDEPAWLWVAVLAATLLAIAACHLLRDRRLPSITAASTRPAVWLGSTGINQGALLYLPIALIAVVGGLVSPVSGLLAFGLPMLAVLMASMKCRITIFEDQVQVENWLGMVLFRVPLSEVQTVGAVERTSLYFGLFFGLGPGWAMIFDESELRMRFWPQAKLRLLLKQGGHVDIGVKHAFDGAQAVYTLLQRRASAASLPPPSAPSPTPAHFDPPTNPSNDARS